MVDLLIASSLFVIIFGILRSFIIDVVLLKVSSKLHKAMLLNVLRANMTFFRHQEQIKSRFNDNFEILDKSLPRAFLEATNGVLRILLILLILVIMNAWLIIPIVVGVFYLVYVIKTSAIPLNEVNRFEKTKHEPIRKQIEVVLKGIQTLRTYETFD